MKKSYDLLVNKIINIPWNWLRNGFDVTKSITWDEKSTTILSASLEITVEPTASDVRSWVDLNTSEVQAFYWALLDSSPKSELVDIIGTLVSGSNTFNFLVAKNFVSALSIDFKITARVIIEYEGNEPSVSLLDQITNFIEENPVLAVGGLIVSILIYKEVKK